MPKRQTYTVTFWGTRGSIPTPGSHTARYGGNTPCVTVQRADGRVVILDAGTGIRALGLELVERQNGAVNAEIELELARISRSFQSSLKHPPSGSICLKARKSSL